MSLINDALKRANQNQKKNPPPPGALSGVPLQPVDGPKKSGGAGKFIPLIAIVLVLAAGLLVWKWSQGGTTEKSAKPIPATSSTEPKATAPAVAEQTPKPVETKPEPAPAHKIQINTNLVVREPVPAPAKPAEPIAAAPTLTPTPTTTTAPAAAPAPIEVKPEPAPTVAAAPTPKTPVVMPELKLQGIFYRLKNSSAMINGKTVNVGESVKGAKIISIDRYQVVIEFEGERKTLTL